MGRFTDGRTDLVARALSHDQSRSPQQEVRPLHRPSTTSPSPPDRAGSPASSGPTAPASPRPCASWSASPHRATEPRPSSVGTTPTCPNPGREVGVLLDASAQHAGRTGREILAVAARTMGLPGARVDEMLERVSLTRRRPTAGCATTPSGCASGWASPPRCIGDPEVLILDEPANGLDPAGIRWMRDLLRDYADQGGTVLLSSHLLHEIEVIADDLVVIGQGRIVAEGTKSELLAAAGTVVRCGAAPRSGPRPRRVRRRPPRRTATAACAPTPTPRWWARSPSPPASPSPSSAPPTARAWRRCSSSSPPRPPREGAAA